LRAIRLGFIKSAHDLSDGGLAVALAECCVMNRKKKIGAKVNLNIKFRSDFYLFSESQSRFIVTISPENQVEFEKLFSGTPIKLEKIGIVEGKNLVINNLIDLSLDEIEDAYYNSFRRLMGEK